MSHNKTHVWLSSWRLNGSFWTNVPLFILTYAVRLWSPLQRKLVYGKNWDVLFSRSHLGECGTLSKVWNALFILIWCAYGLESPVWWKDGQMWCNALTQMHRTLITEGKRKLPPGAVFTATVCVTQHLCWHMRFRFRRRVLKSVPSA